MRNIKIFDKTINFVAKKAKKINGVGAVTYYFNRLTQTSMIPIEITVVKLGEKMYCFSPQLNEYRVKETDIGFYYRNSISLYKKALEAEIDSIPNEKVENKTAEVFKQIFGIDLTNIQGYEGLAFDRIIYTEDFRIEKSDIVADGYIFVFTDLASRRAKLGFFAGNARNLKFHEYVDMLNEYGASNILNGVEIEQTITQTKIKNQTPFLVKIQPYATDYDITPLEFGVLEYKRIKTPTEEITLLPGGEFSLQNENPSFKAHYTLLNNIIAEKYIDSSFKTTDKEYQEQKQLINHTPFEFEISKVGLEPNFNTDINNYMVVTALDTIDRLDKVSYAVLHKDQTAIFAKKTELGTFEVNTAILSYKVTPKGMAQTLIKGFANTGLFTIDKEQFAFDYSFEGTDTFITEIALKTVFNNVTSTYMQVVSVKTATQADYSEFENQNTKIKIEKITKSKGKFAALPFLMKSDVFRHDMVLIDMQQISDTTNRPSFGEYIFKTYVKELDDVVEEFNNKRKEALHNYKFIDMPLQVSSADLAEFQPDSKVWDIDGEDKNDFSYRIKNHLSDLGYEIALENALEKLKKAAYIYAPVKNTIATNHFGVTLDKKWFFFGSNWYKAEEVMHPKITTYIDDVVKEYALDTTKDKFLYVKKVFFGYDNDTNEMVVYARALAECLGTGTPLPRDLQSQNPALTYVMEHVLDNDRVFPLFKEVVVYPTEFVNKYVDKVIKNKYAFPNIFARNLNVPFTPGIYSSARAAEFKRYMLNKGLDVLNSIETLKIETSAFLSFDSDILFSFVDLFNATGYKILGIEDTTLSFDAVINFKFNFAQNIFINERTYDYGMEIYINSQRKFGLYYDVTTKNTFMFLDKGVNVLDYGFMIAMFDSLLLYNVDEIDGYKYYDLGVFINPVLGEEADFKYLYLPTDKVDTKGKSLLNLLENKLLVGASVNFINKSIFVDFLRDKNNSMTYDIGNNVKINISAQFDKETKELVITKEGKTYRIPHVTLANLPTKTLSYNGFTIKPHRVDKFLPNKYRDKYFYNAALRLDLEETHYLTIDYGEAVWVTGSKDIEYLIAFGAEGIVYTVKTKNHIGDFKQLYSIDDILNKVYEKDDLPIKLKIIRIEGGLQ